MKILKNKLLIVTFIILFFVSTCCFASNDVAPIAEGNTVEDVSNDENNVAISPDDVEASFQFISDDLYRVDNDVVVSEMVDGNAFVVGNNVTLSGEINGDFFVIANKLVIEENSYIYGSLLACAPSITVNGNVYDTYALANDFTLGNIGYIARDAKIASNSIALNGTIGRNANLFVNSLTFPDVSENTAIGGNLNYTSPSEAEIPEGIVSGDTQFTLEVVDDNGEFDIASIIVSCINSVLSAVLYSLIVVLLMVWLTPNFIQKSGNIMRKKTPISLAIGLLVFFGAIIGAIAFLFLTYGLGSAISIAVIALLVLLWSISETVFALAGARLLANKLHKDKNLSIVLFTLLNVFIINLIKLIPFVGTVVSFVINIIGLGFIASNLIFKKQDFMTYETTAPVKEEKSEE